MQAIPAVGDPTDILVLLIGCRVDSHEGNTATFQFVTYFLVCRTENNVKILGLGDEVVDVEAHPVVTFDSLFSRDGRIHPVVVFRIRIASRDIEFVGVDDSPRLPCRGKSADDASFGLPCVLKKFYIHKYCYALHSHS